VLVVDASEDCCNQRRKHRSTAFRYWSFGVHNCSVRPIRGYVGISSTNAVVNATVFSNRTVKGRVGWEKRIMVGKKSRLNQQNNPKAEFNGELTS
jgi:hypothetical protein